MRVKPKRMNIIMIIALELIMFLVQYLGDSFYFIFTYNKYCIVIGFFDHSNLGFCNFHYSFFSA